MPLIPCNAKGRRLGLASPQAHVPDLVVRRIRRLRSEGWSYRRIAKDCCVSVGYAWSVCAGVLRTQPVHHFKEE